MNPTLLSQPAEEVELTILKAFFGPGQSDIELDSLKPFLDFYKKEIGELDFGVVPTVSSAHVTIIRSHDDIIHVVNILRANQDNTRLEIRKLLKGNGCRFASTTPDHEIDLTIDLSLRLWLMVNVRCPESKFLTPSTYSIKWDDTTTLRQFIVRQFPRRKLDLEPKHSRLSHMFTVSFMVKVCGLKIEFTSRLENHLRLVRRHKTLLVYPFKACLTGHLQDSPYPDTLLSETIFTLNMLFPDWDEETDKLLKKHGQDFHHSAPFDGPRMLNLNEFEFWGERLLELYEEVFLSPPVSLRQLWSDRRSPQQWSVFWTAQIILALTIVSCLATFVQTWASVKALRLAEEGAL